MSDDDLVRSLEAWADATDPTPEPIGADEVEATARTARAVSHPGDLHPRRWLVAAAVVVLLGGLALVATVRAGDDGPDEVATATSAPGEEAGPRVQVVVALEVGDDLSAGQREVRRIVVREGCPPNANCAQSFDAVLAEAPLLPGPTPVLDRPVDAPGLAVTYEAIPCGTVPCGAVAADGTPVDGGGEPLRCTSEVAVDGTARRVVVAVEDLSGTPPTCVVADPGDEGAPTSTVATDPIDPDRRPSPPSTPAAPAAGAIDVVLDVSERPMCIEGCAFDWVIDDRLGSALATGPLLHAGARMVEPPDADVAPDVMLLSHDLPLAEGAPLGVSIRTFDCFASSDCLTSGLGPAPGGIPFDSCLATAPDERDGGVLVVTARQSSCTATWADAVPALTVPPAYSLRAPLGTDCATLAADTRSGQCLADALVGGTTAEVTRPVGGSRLATYRVAAGGVEVVTSGRAAPWTRQVCTGLDVVDGGRGVEPTGCGAEEEMGLDPP